MRKHWAVKLSVLGIGLVAIVSLVGINNSESRQTTVNVQRLLDQPIITPDLHPSIGVNIQGPSLIRVPDWIERPLGTYYLYFADHKGRYIRLAYADDLLGPWAIHPQGSLQITESYFLTEPPEVIPEELEQFRATHWASSLTSLSHDSITNIVRTEITTPHIASPDVHVDEANQQIVMYFHGLEDVRYQVTRAAVSQDGIHFETRPEILGRSYMRAFAHDDFIYAMSMPGQFYRSEDGFSGFEEGPLLFSGGLDVGDLLPPGAGGNFESNMRHAALLTQDDRLYVFWTQVGHVPERIMVSTIDMSGDWMNWSATDPVEVLRPERDWEGADAPLEPSVRGTAYGHVNQLRDPAIFEENGRTYLLYAVAGERGIAIAEVHFHE